MQTFFQKSWIILFLHTDYDNKLTYKVKDLFAWRSFQIFKSCLIARYDEIAHAAFVEPLHQTRLRKYFFQQHFTKRWWAALSTLLLQFFAMVCFLCPVVPRLKLQSLFVSASVYGILSIGHHQFQIPHIPLFFLHVWDSWVNNNIYNTESSRYATSYIATTRDIETSSVFIRTGRYIASALYRG